MNYIKGLYYL